MFDTKNRSNCSYGDEIVAFIYDEMDSAERETFDAHLKTCRHCPEELAAFSSVSGAINEWKSGRFDLLDTPPSVLPDNVSGAAGTAGGFVEEGIFERFRALLTGLPGMWQAASAFAVIAIVAGLVFFVTSRFTKTSEVAKTPTVETKPDTSSIAPLAVPANDDGNTELANTEKTTVEELEDAPAVSDDGLTEVKITRPRRNTKKRGPSVVKRPLRSTVPTKLSPETPMRADVLPENLEDVPRLSYLSENEEIEDSGLRLSELFAVSDSEDR